MITGYNIVNFDLPYLLNRAAALNVRSLIETQFHSFSFHFYFLFLYVYSIVPGALVPVLRPDTWHTDANEGQDVPVEAGGHTRESKEIRTFVI